jgi:hypothetical protein
MAAFIRNMATNMVKNTLHLEKERPPSRKGSFVVRGEDEAEGEEEGGPATLSTLSTLSIHVIPQTPRYNNLLARVLRMVCMWEESKRHKIVLAGPTLLGWYHVGSQLPWAKATHVIVAGLGEVPEELHHNRAFDSLKNWASAFMDEPVNMRYGHLNTIAIFQGQSRSWSLVVYSAASVPATTHAVLDGGNCQTHVFSDKTHILAALSDWTVAENPNISKARLDKKIKAAYNKLPIPRTWRYDKVIDVFHEPGAVREAFMWPPSIQHLKVWGIIAVILVVAYVVGFYLLPSVSLPRPRPKKKP